MNKHREALRLILTTNMSNRMIGRSVKLSHNTVNRYRRLAMNASLDWASVDEMDDTGIESILKSKRFRIESKRMPDWADVHREMQYRDVTRQLLWEDYRLANPGNAYAYSQFNHYYRQYVGKLDLAMRQTHRAGECVYVDFAGRTVPYFDMPLGATEHAQIFVGALGCSNYAFVYALKSQSLVDWIEAHNKMYQFFGGTPQVVVPDNLKAAVTRAGREPELNRTYLEHAKYYQIAIVPARVRHPRTNQRRKSLSK